MKEIEKVRERVRERKKERMEMFLSSKGKKIYNIL